MPIFFASDSTPPNGLNEDFYVNPKLTDVITLAEATIDQPQAKALFGQAQEILGQDLPTIPIYYMVVANGMSSRLQGLAGNPTNDGDGWNLEDWRFSP